jgi:hypothetical protein
MTSAGSGVAITYVEGNRDFFLRGSYAERFFARVVEQETFQEGRADSCDAWRSPERPGPRLSLLAFFSRRTGSRGPPRVSCRSGRTASRPGTSSPASIARTSSTSRSLPFEMNADFARRRFREGIDSRAPRPIPTFLVGRPGGRQG